MPAKGKPISSFPPLQQTYLKMKKIFLSGGSVILVLLSMFFSFALSAQESGVRTTKLDSIVVEAYRAGKNTPVSHSELGYREIRKTSPVHSVPMMLGLMPSVVVSTEGGNGLGYSSMRIRGSEGSRINVTLNGVALNDSESQELFWVNIPSFSSILEDIQIQRGVGTSVNGPGAFGASVNMRTLLSSSKPYATADLGIASYNSVMTTFGAGTGITDNGYTFDIRFSKNSGDGYIERAGTNLTSLFFTAGKLSERSSLRFNYIMGKQRSGITWEGISREQMEINRRYNPAGLWYDQAGNERFYDNETDNYTQHHLQLVYTRLIKDYIKWGTTLHFTKGDGYYENYKYNKKFSAYGLDNQLIGETLYKKSDFIIRQNMDNGFYAINSNLQFTKERIDFRSGISFSYYDGDHFGNVIWSMYNSTVPDNYQWYMNTGSKKDLSLFARGEYKISESLIAYADLQYRRIAYDMRGEDKDFALMNYSQNYNFFNPKAGVTFIISPGARLFASFAVGQREPGRSDIKESVKAGKGDELKAESVNDFESGFSYSSDKFTFETNIYFMEYRDQLVPTGRLSETGYVIKENVKSSYRRGIEISTAWSPFEKVTLDGNITLSTNKIVDFVLWRDTYDNPQDWNPLSQESIHFDKTDIAFSPGLTGMIRATSVLPGNLNLSVNGRYVSKQYYDNTSDISRSIPSWFIAGINLSREFSLNGRGRIGASFYIDNLFNRKYFSNGWVYTAGFKDGSPLYVEEGLYPQAERNYTLRISFSF